MNVLIIEDDEDKLDQMETFIRSSIPTVEITIAKSLQSGLRAIGEHGFDLILLDMTMPNFDRTLSEDGGRPHAFAGREILRQMKRNRIPTPVIVVTHFDRFGEEGDYMTLHELKRDMESSFPNYRGTVQFRGNVDDWRQGLITFLADFRKDEGAE